MLIVIDAFCGITGSKFWSSFRSCCTYIEIDVLVPLSCATISAKNLRRLLPATCQGVKDFRHNDGRKACQAWVHENKEPQPKWWHVKCLINR